MLSLMALIFHTCNLMVAGKCCLTMDITELCQILNCKVLYIMFTWLFLHNSTFVLFFTFRLIEARAVVFECGPNCGCGPGCVNRTSQRGIKHRLEVSFISISLEFQSCFPLCQIDFVCTCSKLLLVNADRFSVLLRKDGLLDHGNLYRPGRLFVST